MTWTYKNTGLTRLLTSQSVYQLGPQTPQFPAGIYGVAFAQMTDAPCFGVSSAGEVWIRAALARAGSDVSRIGNITGGAFTGVQYGGDGGDYYASIYANGVLVTTLSNYSVIGFRGDIVLHIKSGAADGELDYSLFSSGSLVQSYSHNGDVNSGEALDGVFASGLPGQFWSDVVISDSALTVDNHAGENITLTGDTLRVLTNADVHAVDISADTRRTLYNAAGTPVDISADTRREITNLDYHVIDISADTRRRIANRIEIKGDTRRRIARIVETDFQGPPYPSDGITAINLTLQEATLTDTASYGTVIHTLPKDELRGYILDFPYSFIVESTTNSGLEMTAKCTYDADALFYTPRKTNATQNVEPRAFMQNLAVEMGKSAVFYGDDFIHVGSIGGADANYKSAVSNLFGWSSRVPRMAYNVFIRGASIIVCQRGHEIDTVDLDEIEENGWIASMPTYNRETVRTIWSKGMDEETEDLALGVPVRIVGGDDEYNNEQVTYENLQTPAGEVDSRPSLIMRDNPDGSHTTISYSYQWTGTNYVLRSEEETTKDADGNTISHSITYHEILAGGWRNSVTIADDGEGNTIGVGSTGGRTRPGDMATSAYSDQVKLARGGKWTGVKNGIDGGTSLIDTDFPVDDATAKKCINEIKWMNRKIREVVTIDIVPPVSFSVPAYGHIIDFTDVLTYHGNQYYLISNTVSFTPTSHRQTIKIGRWF